jgi:hypothetical protein
MKFVISVFAGLITALGGVAVIAIISILSGYLIMLL